MRLDANQAAAVELAGEVKAELVAFAMSPAFEKHLRRITRELAGQEFHDQDLLVEALERLLFSFTYDDGTTVVDRFLRRTGLSVAEQAMVRGLVSGVEGYFEVTADTAAGAEVFEVRCCLSDLEHAVAPTLATELPRMPRGTFLAGRLNPLAGTELWTLSGVLRMVPADRREAVAAAALELSLQAPWLTHRNPEKLRKAGERVATLHENFIARHGGDLVLVAGTDLPDLFAEAMTSAGDHDPVVVGRSRAKLRENIESSELVHDDQVLVHSHPVAGLGFYCDFAPVARALEAGAAAAEDDLEFLRGYLDDPGVPAWLLRRIVTDRLPAAQSAVALAARRHPFDWEQDGEKLLASLPGDQEPRVTLAIVPSISADPPSPS